MLIMMNVWEGKSDATFILFRWQVPSQLKSILKAMWVPNPDTRLNAQEVMSVLLRLQSATVGASPIKYKWHAGSGKGGSNRKVADSRSKGYDQTRIPFPSHGVREAVTPTFMRGACLTGISTVKPTTATANTSLVSRKMEASLESCENDRERNQKTFAQSSG